MEKEILKTTTSGENHDHVKFIARQPITDDYGVATTPQYRVLEQRGNWFLLYDQQVVGNKVVHEFRIQKLKHDIYLYPGISLQDAKRIFDQKIEEFGL